MSDSEDEDRAYYGTPLDPLDEDSVPRKKPILIQDQIATDKHGRRRFHGAFTGGFSAGFFNTVGTLEGWKPSQFKSSRDNKATGVSQRPEDFMDEEDTDDFGIAPTKLRAKPEYSGSNATKRKMNFSDGPIPGEPVLRSILEPSSVTVGMKLLMRLGWKPGQGIGPMLTWAEKMGDDADPKELGLDPNVLFPPTPVEEHFIKPKADRFGLGYVGLSKEPVLQQRFSLFDDPLKLNENKKKLSIRGQAFGVGAFEVEDEDIYAKDDMSQYDFALETSASLREARRKEREKEKLAICESYDCLEGFQPAKNNGNNKKYFPPPELPADFDPNLSQKKSRFDSEIRGNPEAIRGKHIINSADRAAILGETPDRQNETQTPDSNEKLNDIHDNVQTDDSGFKPFVSDPSKQRRYEKYLGFIRIGAKDALKNIQPSDMTEWERGREASEFEQAAKLYRPLSGMMGDRFSRGGMLDDSSDQSTPIAETKPAGTEPWVIAAKEKKFGKLTRFIADWDPVPILCKRMNIPEPRSHEVTLAKVSEETAKRKPKFSVFDFLDTSKTAMLKDELDQQAFNDLNEEKSNKETLNEKHREKLLLPEPLLDPKIVESEDPIEKMDLFKAIFASDDESETEDEKKTGDDKKASEKPPESEKFLNNKNVLRNTSPPRGIFANLDLEALKPKPLPPKDNKTDNCSNNKCDSKSDSDPKKETSNEEVDPGLLYGPSLPSKPIFIPQKISNASESSSSSEEEWVEKATDKSKKKKHSKKHKKEKKREKHKAKKKKKKR